MSEHLPSLEGTTLSGRIVRFPADLPEAGLVLVIGFAHAARHDVGAWKAALTERGIPFLSLPTAAMDQEAVDMAAVAQAMRAHVPRPAWEQVVQIHRGGEALRRQFGWQADVFAKVVRVGCDGAVLSCHGSGPMTEAAISALLG